MDMNIATIKATWASDKARIIDGHRELDRFGNTFASRFLEVCLHEAEHGRYQKGSCWDR